MLRLSPKKWVSHFGRCFGNEEPTRTRRRPSLRNEEASTTTLRMYRAVVEESAILGIVGAFVATYLGQAIGWYGPDQNAGFIGAIVGAAIILLVWGFIERRRRVWIRYHPSRRDLFLRQANSIHFQGCNNICRQYSGEAMDDVLGKPLKRSVI
jgi:hypothetical protein